MSQKLNDFHATFKYCTSKNTERKTLNEKYWRSSIQLRETKDEMYDAQQAHARSKVSHGASEKGILGTALIFASHMLYNFYTCWERIRASFAQQ